MGSVNCPTCHAEGTRVVDSRVATEGAAIRRRRQCGECEARFTTFERVEEVPLMVAKRDGSVQSFDRDKLVGGIASATKGRPVNDDEVSSLITTVEDEVRLGASPVTSSQIGLAVLERLRCLDEVAYLRYASVYKNFDAAADFQSELELLKSLGS